MGIIQTITCLILFGLTLIGTINNQFKKGKTILQRQLEEKKKHNLEQERRNIETKKIQAKERERARDYDTAIRIWEELGEIEAAARIRKLKAEQSAVKVSQKIVHGDEVTEIKDSVLNRSNVGSGGGSSKAEELREAKSLLDEGLINEYDYENMKKEILGK
jgi:hypothetical protein